MGVGVYDSDFDETGGAFIVDGTLCTQEDYKAYCEGDPENTMDYSAWSQNEVDNEVERLNDLILEAGVKLGFDPRAYREFGGEDGAFRVLAERNGFILGVRGWEHDHIVGVWQPNINFGCDRDDAKQEIAADYMDNPATVLAVRDKLSIEIQEYVRLCVQEEFECSYKVNGYQSESYADLGQDELNARLAELEASIKKGFDYVSMGKEARIKTWDTDAFKAMVEAFREDGYWRPINVPVYDAEENGLIWVDPTVSLDSEYNLKALDKVFDLPEGVERPVVGEGERYAAFASSDALLQVCRESIIENQFVYRAPLSVPAELWCDVCSEELNLTLPVEPEDYSASLSM
ncbi:hypothetical protein [Geopseudomonas aromaticivorans]